MDLTVKEVKEKLGMKDERQSKEIRNNDIDKIPSDILVNILESMDIKEAVQTCVLSKQWKDLWKSMVTFSLISTNFRRVVQFNRFVSQLLKRRDSSISLLNVYVLIHRSSLIKTLNRLIAYAARHNVEQMALHFSFFMMDSKFPSFKFKCSSLVHLHLSHKHFYYPVLKFPNSLPLPSLKKLHLDNLCFTQSFSNCSEPFSGYNLLQSLTLKDCSLHRFDTNELCISNSNLSNLVLHNFARKPYKFLLLTPNLSYLTITGRSYICNRSFLAEENVKARSWLQLLANVKEMTLPVAAIGFLLEVLSKRNVPATQAVCFAKLRSLKLMKDLSSVNFDEAVYKMVQYVRKNSPLARVHVIDVISK